MSTERTDDTDFSGLRPTDRILAALWMEVLQLTSPPRPSDNFFSLGGDSMAAVTLEFRIEEELSVHLLPGTLFGAPTLGELSCAVGSMIEGADAAQDPSPSDPGDCAGRPVDQA